MCERVELLVQNAKVDDFVKLPRCIATYSGFRIKRWWSFPEYHWELKHRSGAGKFWTYSENDEYKTVRGCKRNLLQFLDLPENRKAGFNLEDVKGKVHEK